MLVKLFESILPFVVHFFVVGMVMSQDVSFKRNGDFLNCSCGRFPSTNRLIDDSVIPDAEYPWLVGVLNGNNPDTSVANPLCYGALISDRHVLSAASCLRKKKSTQISVYFYGNNIMTRRRRTIRDISLHEEYTQLNDDNNLAILTLAIPLKLEEMNAENPMMSPICIPNPFVFTGRLDKMKGMMVKMQRYKTGLVGIPRYYFGSVPVKIHGIRNPACSNIYSERAKEKTLCFDGDSTACYGDEGSPLIITLSESGQIPVSPDKGKYYALGIYSKGYGCDGFQQGKSNVDVSTNLLNHSDWIVRKTRDGNFCS